MYSKLHATTPWSNPRKINIYVKHAGTVTHTFSQPLESFNLKFGVCSFFNCTRRNVRLVHFFFNIQIILVCTRVRKISNKPRFKRRHLRRSCYRIFEVQGLLLFFFKQTCGVGNALKSAVSDNEFSPSIVNHCRVINLIHMFASV